MSAARNDQEPRAPAVGPAPRQQQSWDWRAAANFMMGGAGSGLIAFAALAGSEGLAGAVLLLVALGLVGGGLACVWLEIGRPRRALHVFFNPRRSWMSREAFAGLLLFPLTLGAALGEAACRAPAALLALAFLYCQSRILQRARGIPAWREPLLVPFIVSTGLVEGAGLFFALQPWLAQGTRDLFVLFGGLVLLRLATWLFYRRRVARSTPPAALAAIDRAGAILQLVGTLAPLLLIALVVAGIVSGPGTSSAALVAGVAAAAAGAWTKYVLVTRAGFHQGFTLRHWPVRGARP
jgi:phenylacetyl-CoA:acceptor oxidoreductase subunit 2